MSQLGGKERARGPAASVMDPAYCLLAKPRLPRQIQLVCINAVYETAKAVKDLDEEEPWRF
ncbi:hypothetical protein GCM10025779_29620 [Arthrobacter cryoconiti]